MNESMSPDYPPPLARRISSRVIGGVKFAVLRLPAVLWYLSLLASSENASAAYTRAIAELGLRISLDGPGAADDVLDRATFAVNLQHEKNLQAMYRARLLELGYRPRLCVRGDWA